MVLRKKIWYYDHNNGTMNKNPMVLYYTIQRTMERRIMKENNMVDYQKLRNFDL